ncbi:MAG: hypothetical protein E3J54_04470, partial [Actinobacteria bacterium]
EASSLVEFRSSDDKASSVAGDPKLVKGHTVQLKNLKASKTYSFKLKSRDKDDNIAESAGILSFRTKSTDTGFEIEPTASKVSEQELTATSAKISWTTAVATSSWVEYGTSTSYGKLAGNDTLTIDHVVTLEGLVPGTTYHYRVKGIDEDGNEYISGDYTFTALINPEIASKPKVEVTNDTAIISWSTNTDTDSIAEYGLTSKYGDSVGSGVLTKIHELEVKDLAQDTTYRYRVGGVDKFSNKAMSEDLTFKTNKDTKGPVVSEFRSDLMRNVDETGKEKINVIVSFTTDEAATSYIEYAEGISLATYNKRTKKNKTLNISHSLMLEGLSPATTFHYRIVTIDKYGNESKSKDKTLLTPKREESILQKIIKILEDTFGWVSNLKDYMQGNYKK